MNKLNEKRPWVTKDPRMSLVAAEWMQLLDAPACIIMHREPLSVANSMMIYSHNVSLAEWVSVYENYYASTMRACDGVRALLTRNRRKPSSVDTARAFVWLPPLLRQLRDCRMGPQGARSWRKSSYPA